MDANLQTPDVQLEGSKAAPPTRKVRITPFPLDPVLIAAGATVVARSLWRGLRGWKRYPGSAQAICEAVIEDCWNGRFFAGSAGHFRQFWTRDLGMCTPALVRLGYRDRVVKSWEWALERFERADRVTTTIFFDRYPRDVYDYAVDSLPLLLYALRSLPNADRTRLIRQHRKLLAREILRFHEIVFDPETELARTEGYFSSMRDCMTGRSTVTANSYVAALAHMLEDEPSLPNPFADMDVPWDIIERYWTGDHFRDAQDREEPSGDANVWPFYLRIFGDDDLPMRRAAFAMLEERGFTKPIPLRYFERRLPKSELAIPRMFTPNYQGDTSWTQLGPIYLKLLRDVDEPLFLKHRAGIAALIERDQNYLELYTPSGRPYVGRAGTYRCDEGMIWAALFLDLF